MDIFFVVVTAGVLGFLMLDFSTYPIYFAAIRTWYLVPDSPMISTRLPALSLGYVLNLEAPVAPENTSVPLAVQEPTHAV